MAIRFFVVAGIALLPLHAASSMNPSQSVAFDARDASRMLASVADTNQDAVISAEERGAFLEAFATSSEAELPRDLFLALALSQHYDRDGDGSFDKADLAALLARWDKDGNGKISMSERLNGPRQNKLLDDVVIKALDVDQNGSLTVEEWSASSSLDLAAWLGAVADIPEDPNGFGPGTMVLTLRVSLDTNTDGAFRRDDLVQLFSGLDLDGNGSIDSAELNAPKVRVTSDWSVSPESRQFAPVIPWQRSLEDALALSKATNKPLLVCVNADGEAASERLAYGRYRDPAFAELVAGFIPILASPNNHTDPDIDTRGRRVECTRFGRLLCAEHSDHEPLLFERYFSDQRVAPRHVGVAPDGTILFDLLLLNDLGRIDRALKKHGNFETSLPDPAGLSTEELLLSPDAGARSLLAQRFLSSPTEERIRLTARALSPTRATQHPELLCLALFDASPLVRSAGAIRTTEAMNEEFVDFAPRVRWIAAEDAGLRRNLIAALFALADTTETRVKEIRARRLARVYAALELAPPVDVTRWRIALRGAPRIQSVDSPEDGIALEAALAELDDLLRNDRHDPDLTVLLAQTNLRLAQRAIRGEGGGNAQFFLQDTVAHAKRVLAVRPHDFLAHSILARAYWWLNKPEQAADEAAGVLPGFAAIPGAPVAGELLDILGQGRARELYRKLGTDEGWPEAWVPQAAAAYELLIAHPSCSEAQALAGVSLMENLEDYRGQARMLRTALLRFPASADLHSWLRWQVMRDGDGERTSSAALEQAYADLPVPAGLEATWLWFEGLAQFTAAQGFIAEDNADASSAAYANAIASFERSIEGNPSFAESTQQYLDSAKAALGIQDVTEQ